MKHVGLILIACISLLIGCKTEPTGPDYNSEYESLANVDAKAAIALANEWRFSAPKIVSYINSKEVVITFPDGKIVKKQLPDSAMYIAIAPYKDSTHECGTHYPSSCKGELSEKVLKVTVKDESGKAYYDADITASKIGFFELWLPRDKTYKIHIEYGALKADDTFATKSDSKTCITTIQVK